MRALDAFNQKSVIISRYAFKKISLEDIFKKKKKTAMGTESWDRKWSERRWAWEKAS